MNNLSNKILIAAAAVLFVIGLPIGVWSKPVSASGGDIVYDTVEGDISYRVHVFTNTGSAMLTVSNGGFVDCLIVGGGGGGGGGAMSGGGGGGGVITMQNLSMTSGVYEITVGAGGLGGYAYNLSGQTGARGGNSLLGGEWVAVGGGGGCGWTGHPSTSGGSGGGGNSMMAASPGVAGQGHAGNIGNNTSSKRSGGGGGGAGEIGGLGTAGAGGKGGDGREVYGSYYGGGGGGGLEGTPLTADGGGAGGLGGGGAGSKGSTKATNAEPNTGGGGGGAGYNGSSSGRLGGNGGSGIVIVRYASGPVVSAPPVTLADIATGNERYTNSNEVRIAAFPAYDGYDQFQCTGESSTPLALDAGSWASLTGISEYYATFTRPTADTNITLYVWFTNTTDTAQPLLRSAGQINYVTDVSDSVLEFFPPASFVNLGKPAALQLSPNHPLTVEGWVRFKSFSAEDLLFCKNNAARGSTYSYMFGLRGNGTAFSAYTGGLGSPVNTWVDIPLPEALEIERWYHLAFAYDGSHLSGYVDGKKIGAIKFSYGNYTAHTMTIGGFTDASDVDAWRSDVRLWDYARNEKDLMTYRDRRLSGSEPGLVGYWPLNDWSGTKVFDRTDHASTGTIVKARSTFSEGFSLAAPPQGFALTAAFTLANIETGSERFTNSNEVDVITFPLPAGVDQYQITQSGEVSAIDANGWTSTNTLPAQLSFTTPDTDTNITFYAWFTNNATGSALLRAEGHIFFTRVQPVPAVRTTLTREGLTGSNVIVYASDLDLGSTGGVANGTVLEVVDRMALAAEPGNDLTPGEPYVTLAVGSEYPLLLWLKNEAGNTMTSVATCLVSVVSYSGTNAWTGLGYTDEWHDPANWGAGVPVDGQDVVIGSGSLRLTAATAKLRSFTLAQGATLSVEGWESAIQANEIVVAGTITHAAQTVTEPDSESGEWIPQHRIWLKGTNFTLTSSGKLNADEKGYGPGDGPGGGFYTYSGAGYGGNGGAGFRGRKGAPSYGTPEDPWQPGSGGLGNYGSGSGGGAIRIEMTNAVVIHGTATACGKDFPSTHCTGGSGGGISIICKTFQGAATGLIKVDGGRGYYYGANSGGGRIALHYDPTSQAAMIGPRPAVRFSAYANQEISRPSDQPERTMLAQMGTLYLPDTALLTSAPEGDVVLGDQRFWYTRLYIASHPESWSPASLTMTNCVIGFRGGSAYDTGEYEGFDLNVAGDLTLITDLTTPKLMMGYFIEAGLYMYAARTNELYGAKLNVGGNLMIGPKAALYHWTSGYSGAIVGIRVENDVTVAAGGKIDAVQQGFMPHPGNLNGPGAGKAFGVGGSYGGVGQGDARPAYGLAALPLELGSPGEYDQRHGIPWTPTGRGGGAIQILAGGTITVDGLLDANGGKGGYYETTAGSGGSIFLAAMKVRGSGTLRARGLSYYASTKWGCSGGGRIAIWHSLSLTDIERRISERNTSGLHHRETYSSFDGELDVSAYEPYATPGTKGFYCIGSTLILLR